MNITANKVFLTQLIGLLDLTSLNPDDTEEKILKLCLAAQTPFGHVAAVCIYPQFINIAKTTLTNQVKIATVVNFPAGTSALEDTLEDIQHAVAAGADEIDLVMPYQDLIKSHKQRVEQYLTECRLACSNKILKIILETGELKELTLIRQASRIALSAKADFLKTSTGKTSTGATLDAVKIMLDEIKKQNSTAGIKAAGGIRTVEQALQYHQLLVDEMGADWVQPKHCRFGASSLLNDILLNLR